MDMNRRSFLIGSASAVVLAATGMPAEPGLCRGILSPGHSFRRIVELTFEVKNPPGRRLQDFRPPSVLRVMRAGMDVPILQALVRQPWGNYRWVARGDDGIILREKDALQVVIDPPCASASLEVISHTKEAPEVDAWDCILEKLTWDNGELAEVGVPMRLALPPDDLETAESETVLDWIIRGIFG